MCLCSQLLFLIYFVFFYAFFCSLFFFFFKQKTAYEMRISDWSPDVCSSDLFARVAPGDRREIGHLFIQRDRLLWTDAPGDHRPDVAGVDAMLDVERRIVIAAQVAPRGQRVAPHVARRRVTTPFKIAEDLLVRRHDGRKSSELGRHVAQRQSRLAVEGARSEEHTSELQSLMRIY